MECTKCKSILDVEPSDEKPYCDDCYEEPLIKIIVDKITYLDQIILCEKKASNMNRTHNHHILIQYLCHCAILAGIQDRKYSITKIRILDL